MKRIILLTIVFLMITILSCEKSSLYNFEKIQIGMSRIEVEKIFGKSQNGSYSKKTTQILFEYNNDTVVSRTYLVRDKNNSNESILEGTLWGMLGINPGQTNLTQANTAINDYELIVSDYTKYVDGDNWNLPFDLVFGSFYKVSGKFERYSSGSTNSYKGKILLSKIEKVFLQSELNPKDALTFAKRGKKKLDYKDYKGAMADYTKAIDLEPSDTLYYLGRSLVKNNLKDREGAKLDLEKAAKLGSRDAQMYLDKYFK